MTYFYDANLSSVLYQSLWYAVISSRYRTHGRSAGSTMDICLHDSGHGGLSKANWVPVGCNLHVQDCQIRTKRVMCIKNIWYVLIWYVLVAIHSIHAPFYECFHNSRNPRQAFINFLLSRQKTIGKAWPTGLPLFIAILLALKMHSLVQTWLGLTLAD